MMKTLMGSPVRKSSRLAPDHIQDGTWINEHAEGYRGPWVMMKDGKLLARDPNGRARLKKEPEAEQVDSLVAYIPTIEEAQRVYL